MAGLFGGLGKIGKGVIGGVGHIAKDVLETTEETVENVGELLLGPKKDDNNEYEYYDDAEKDDDPDDDEEDEAERKLTESGDTVMEDEPEKEEETVIPKHSSLKSLHNNNYLRYINQDEDTEGFLRFSGDKVVSPYTKFEFRASKTDKRLVHIRCCYNNKFWAHSDSPSGSIAAVLNEEQDDPSKPSCTLFEPIYDFQRDAYRLRHVQLDAFVGLDPSSGDYLVASKNNQALDGLFKVVDWDSIFILPKYVAFKGNNGKYLEPSGKYLKFSASDAEKEAAAHEIIATRDGYIRIRHVQSGKYWIRDPNWIWVQSIDTKKEDPNTLFWPVKVDNNVVALRNMGNNQYCKRLTIDGKENCLNAAVRTISETARLEVTEVVEARTIEDVEYRLKDARVYGKNVLAVSKGVAVNNTDVADQVTFKFRYEQKKESTWSSSVSMTLGVSAKFTSKVPGVSTQNVELSFEASSENSWGETKKDKSMEETTHSVTVPARSKVKISGIITEAKCDVPFSYTRKDTLKSGLKVSRRFNDGIFTGVNTFDFKFETEDVKAP